MGPRKARRSALREQAARRKMGRAGAVRRAGRCLGVARDARKQRAGWPEGAWDGGELGRRGEWVPEAASRMPNSLMIEPLGEVERLEVTCDTAQRRGGCMRRARRGREKKGGKWPRGQGGRP